MMCNQSARIAVRQTVYMEFRQWWITGSMKLKPEDWLTFATLGQFQASTNQETHGIEVDYSDFEALSPPDPAQRHAVYHAVDLNFKLKSSR
jgi:hypothetical protein